MSFSPRFSAPRKLLADGRTSTSAEPQNSPKYQHFTLVCSSLPLARFGAKIWAFLPNFRGDLRPPSANFGRASSKLRKTSVVTWENFG